MTTAIDKGAYVREMFARIAPNYDRANRVLTGGMDERWRHRATAILRPPHGGEVLDLCCGTGDVVFHLLRVNPSLHVTGIDFCAPMLDGARARAEKEARGDATFVEGDVMALPFEDGAFDGAIMGFSLRNVVDIVATLREARRVLRPGARFVNLDVTRVPNPLVRRAFELYFYGIVPLVGGIVGGSKSAYRYLPSSLVTFPDADGIAERFATAGFKNVRYVRLGMGAIAIHIGVA